MIRKKIRYAQLRSVLEALGYASRPVKVVHMADVPCSEPLSQGVNGVVFHNPKTSLEIILPRMKDEDVLTGIDLLRVQTALVNAGVIADDGFEWLFKIRRGEALTWKDPSSGAQAKVTAASDESDDGIVIIKQKGTLAACPAVQLQKTDLKGMANGVPRATRRRQIVKRRG